MTYMNRACVVHYETSSNKQLKIRTNPARTVASVSVIEKQRRKRRRSSSSSLGIKPIGITASVIGASDDLDAKIFTLFCPALAALLLDPLLSAVDTAFVGRYDEIQTPNIDYSHLVVVRKSIENSNGDDDDDDGVSVSTTQTTEVGEESELASLAVSTTLFNFVSYSGSFLAIATAPLVAKEVGKSSSLMASSKADDGDGDGEKKKSKAGKTVSVALLLAISIGIVSCVFVQGFLPQLLSLSGGDYLGEKAYEGAEAYVRIRALGLPFFCISLICIGAFRGIGDTKKILDVALIAETVHFILDFLLVPSFGIKGAAVGTLCSTFLEFYLFFKALFDSEIVSKEDLVLDFRDDVSAISKKMGTLVSNGTNQLIRTLLLQAVLVRATDLASANNVSAAHQIVSEIWWIDVFFLDALAITAQTLVGTPLATETTTTTTTTTTNTTTANTTTTTNVILARNAVDRCLQWSFALGIVLFVTTEIFAEDLPKIFTNDANVIAQTIVPITFFLAPLQPLSSLVFVWDGVFQGANDFKFLARAMIVCSSLSILSMTRVPYFASSSSAFNDFFAAADAADGLSRVWSAIAILMLSRALTLAFRYWFDDRSPLYVKR